MPFTKIFHKKSKKSLNIGPPTLVPNTKDNSKLLNLVSPNPQIVKVSSPLNVPVEDKKIESKIQKSKSTGFLNIFHKKESKNTVLSTKPSLNTLPNNNQTITKDEFIIPKENERFLETIFEDRIRYSLQRKAEEVKAKNPPMDYKRRPMVFTDSAVNLNDLPHSTEIDIECDDNFQQNRYNVYQNNDSMINNFHYSKLIENSILNDLSSLDSLPIEENQPLILSETDNEKENSYLQQLPSIMHKKMSFPSSNFTPGMGIRMKSIAPIEPTIESRGRDYKESEAELKFISDQSTTLNSRSTSASNSVLNFKTSRLSKIKKNGSVNSAIYSNTNGKNHSNQLTPRNSAISLSKTLIPKLLRSSSNLKSDDILNDELSYSVGDKKSLSEENEDPTISCSNSNTNTHSNNYSEFDTIKDVNIQVIKNYNKNSSKLRVVSSSPVRSHGKSPSINSRKSVTETPKIAETKFLNENIDEILENRMLENDEDIDYFKPSNPVNLIKKDEVYREEMLSLIERHSLMVSKKQEEINHLRNLLQQERRMTSFLSLASSPQQRHETTPSSSPKLPNSPDFNGNRKMIRKKFIPIDITLTQESKPNNFVPYNRNTMHLLPPFETSPKEQRVRSSHSIPNKLNINDIHGSADDFIPKPFHNPKAFSPRQQNLEFFDNVSEETKIESTDNLHDIQPLKRMSLASKHSSINSNSSAYYTAFDESFESIELLGDPVIIDKIVESDNENEVYHYHKNSTPVNIIEFPKQARDFSGSTTMSSVMSKVRNNSNDSILSSFLLTPDTEEFDIIKK